MLTQILVGEGIGKFLNSKIYGNPIFMAENQIEDESHNTKGPYFTMAVHTKSTIIL